MATLHAMALGRNSAKVLAKISILLASVALGVSCASAPRDAGKRDFGLAYPRVIHLETNQFLWTDAIPGARLVCANGTPVVCTGGQSRLSPARCGCLRD
jgi:hypothetical protein